MKYNCTYETWYKLALNNLGSSSIRNRKITWYKRQHTHDYYYMVRLLTRSSFSASNCWTFLSRASLACSTRLTGPLTTMWLETVLACGTVMSTSYSSIMARISLPRWPMIKRWYSYGTGTSTVTGVRSYLKNSLKKLYMFNLYMV